MCHMIECFQTSNKNLLELEVWLELEYLEVQICFQIPVANTDIGYKIYQNPIIKCQNICN